MIKRYPFIQILTLPRTRKGACLGGDPHRIARSTVCSYITVSPIDATDGQTVGGYETFPTCLSSSSARSEGKPMPLIRQNKTKLATP